MTGRITAADGTTPISGATVGLASTSKLKAVSESVPLRKVRQMKATVNTDGPTTTTNPNGEYSLSGVPSGTQTLAAKKGVFEITFSVEVKANATVQSDDNETRVQPTKNLGVVLGAFDSIEEIVEDLGYASVLDTLQNSDLDDATLLSNYSIVFLNCGSNDSYPIPSARINALRQYINNGGTLYTSDLEQDYVEELYPGSASFDNNTRVQGIRARIASNDLRQFVGRDSIGIAYDLPGWERIVSTSATSSYPTPEPLLSGQPAELSNGSEPLAITYDANPGRLVYTTFHNEAGATQDQLTVLKYYVFLP